MPEQEVASRQLVSARTAHAGRFVTVRAVALGLLIIPLNAYWLTWNVWYQYHLSGDTPLLNAAVFILMLLIAGNAGVARVWPRKKLAPGELLVVYIMVTFGTIMCANAWDWMVDLPTNLIYPARYATPANGWARTLLPLLPLRLVVTDPAVVAGFWEGQSSPYTKEVWAAWGGPILWWTSFIVVLVWVLLCMNSLVRRRWMEEEKLAFPIVEVPLAMVRPGGELWRSRLFQIGVALTVAVNLVNLAASFLPAVPGFSFAFDYGEFTRNISPWSGIRQPWLWYSPFMIGFCYLMPLDLLFSLWVFTLVGKVQQVLTIQFGWNTQTWGGPPYIDSQSLGALLALVAVVFWLDRHYLAALLRGALFGRGALGDREEALPHRMALLGIVVGGGYLFWFVCMMGMTAPVAIGFLVIFLAISMGLSRLRAQLGSPHHELLSSFDLLLSGAGTSTFKPTTLAAFTLLAPITGSQRENPSPMTLEAFRMGRGHAGLRALPPAILLAVAMGVVSLFWANLQIHYPLGAGMRTQMAPVQTATWRFDSLATNATQPGTGDSGPFVAMAVGAVAFVALMWAKLTWPRFPLHPIALPVATGGAIEGTVAAVFIAWVIKAAVLRWGGQRLYRPSLYLMIGVIVGDATASALVAILRQVCGVPVSAGAG